MKYGKTKRSKLNEAQQRQVAGMYLSGLSPIEITKIWNFPISTGVVYYALMCQNVDRRSCAEASEIYDRNKKYFNQIDSHEKAQILGMLAADGCIHESKHGQRVLSIILKEDDKDYLEHIKKCLGYTGPITRLTNSIGNYFSRLGVTCSEYFSDLNRLGLTPRKSLTLQFPNSNQVPDEFVPSFICGYLEGDGSIVRRYRKTSPDFYIGICVTKEFGERLSIILLEKLGITSKMLRKQKLTERNINSYAFFIKGNLQCVKFLDWIYANVPFKMQRKYERYLELKSLYDENGEFIVTSDWLESKKKKFNKTMKERGRDPANNEKKSLYAVHDNGTVYHITGIAAFCREMGLACAGLSRLNTGLQKKYREYVLATPDQIAAARASNSLIEKHY